MLIGFEMIGFGFVLVAAFAYINLVLQPKWFPQETAGLAGAGKPPKSPSSHFALGVLLFVLLFVGVTIITAGAVEIGILRSRG